LQQSDDAMASWYSNAGGLCSEGFCEECEYPTPCSCCGNEWAGASAPEHITIQKVEPKLFFANERTFISWLHMAVVMASIAIGVLAFTPTDAMAQDFAMCLMPIALMFVGYALRTYLVRSEKIKSRDANRWDDPYGPVILTSCLVIALLVQFCLKLSELVVSQPSTPVAAPTTKF
jgi:uncharacterized membrane protein YidH (DUF202 family)